MYAKQVRGHNNTVMCTTKRKGDTMSHRKNFITWKQVHRCPENANEFRPKADGIDRSGIVGDSMAET
jgi:hypothetical protein